MVWKGAFSSLIGHGLPPSFPGSFLFGVATADHQCESYRLDRLDVRDLWESDRGLVTRGRATDFEKRYPEDIALAKSLGCNAFRFSIAWSRIEPAPGKFDEAAFDHYKKLIRAIRSAGMEPILTLHHFTWPLHVQQSGGMISDDFPKVYSRYVREVAARLGRDVRYWITFNEPNQLIFGYIKPWWMSDYAAPPGLLPDAGWDEQIDAVSKLIRNLFVAHAGAYRIIKAANPEAFVGANPLLLGLPVWLQRLINWNAERMTADDLRRQGRRFSEHSPLARGKADIVIANLTRTAERERLVMFSEVYFATEQRLLGKASGPAVQPSDLSGKAVVAVKGSTAERNAPTLLPNSQLTVAEDYPFALLDLDQGRAEALLSDDIIENGIMRRFPGRYRFVGQPLTGGTQKYAVAVSQGNGEILNVVNSAIQEFSDTGKWQMSFSRNLSPLGLTAPNMPPGAKHPMSFFTPNLQKAVDARSGRERVVSLARKGTGLRRIQDRGYLIAVTKSDVPGLSFQDSDTGEFAGLEIDLARAISERIFSDPGRVRFLPAKTAERIPQLLSPLSFLDTLMKTYSVLSTIVASNWWHLGMAGKLPAFLCPAECRHLQDFVGLDYYWGISALRLDRIQALIDAGLGRFDLAPVYAGALFGHLRYLSEMFPNLPLLIAENGSVDEADNLDRAAYLRAHISQVRRAVGSGTNMLGYTCWAITSNREWGLEFGKSNDFGLYHIELDSDPELKRMKTEAATEYRRIIESMKSER